MNTHTYTDIADGTALASEVRLYAAIGAPFPSDLLTYFDPLLFCAEASRSNGDGTTTPLSRTELWHERLDVTCVQGLCAQPSVLRNLPTLVSSGNLSQFLLVSLQHALDGLRQLPERPDPVAPDSVLQLLPPAHAHAWFLIAPLRLFADVARDPQDAVALLARTTRCVATFVVLLAVIITLNAFGVFITF